MKRFNNLFIYSLSGSKSRAGSGISCCLFTLLAALIMIIMTSPKPLTAQEGKATFPQQSSLQKNREFKLSLKDAVSTALINNLDIASEKFNPQIAATGVEAARSEFHPILFMGIDGDRSINPSSSIIFTNKVFVSDFNLNAGVKAKLITGGSVKLSYDSNRNNSNSQAATLDPTFNTDITLTFSQPILRDYGITINKSNITISENSRQIAEIGLASRVNDVVAQTETAYWTLVSTIEILKVREKSLDLAKDLLRKNKIQVEVGVLAPVEILQAEAVVAARQEALINSRVDIKDAEDRLRRIMNPTQHQNMWELNLKPTDKPSFKVYRPALDAMLKKAFANRYDYRQAKIDLENRGIRVGVAKNGLLPKVDLVGSLGFNGLAGQGTSALGSTTSPFDGNYSDSIREMISGDFYSYSLGLSLEYPLWNVAPRSEYTKRKLEEQQAVSNLHNLELIIQEQTRKAVRRLLGDLERVQATKIASDLAQARLEAEEKKFEVGISTNFEVLELQEDLAIAENNEVRAIIDYNNSIVALQKTTATLLQNRKISIE